MPLCLSFHLEEEMSTPAYVILRGLVEGNRFFTSHKPGEDPTKLNDGTIAYEVLGYANTIREAQIKLYGRSFTSRSD